MTNSFSPIRITTFAYHDINNYSGTASHSHKLPQWYCVIKGKLEYTVDGKTILLNDYDSVFVKPGEIRTIKKTTAKIKYLHIIFEDLSLNVSYPSATLYHLPLELRSCLSSLIKEHTNPGLKNSNTLIDVLASRILIELNRDSRRLNKDGALNPLKNRELIEQADIFIQHNYNKPIVRADVSSLIGLSSVHFARLFKEITGTTFGQRLTEVRLQAAQRFLKDSSLSISLISVEVGFNSFSHFTQLFKKEIGLSPSDYRRKNAI
ncbi:MAG: hypothetical protein COA79_18940 [Planctomycetota bacterium]|nr:MAG: hypothetical protein COA79_18940 [Planctomycetota bacterium]